MNFNNILSAALSAIFNRKVILNIVDNIINVYINGIGGCILKIEDKDIRVLQFDVSEEMVKLIRQTIMSCLE